MTIPTKRGGATGHYFSALAALPFQPGDGIQPLCTVADNLDFLLALSDERLKIAPQEPTPTPRKPMPSAAQALLEREKRNSYKRAARAARAAEKLAKAANAK
jgi:hypothetical protein